MFPLLLTRPNNQSGPSGPGIPENALVDDDGEVLVDDDGEILIED